MGKEPLFGLRVLLQNGESLVHGRHELRGEDDRGIFLGRYFCHGLERAQLQRHGVRRNDVYRSASDLELSGQLGPLSAISGHRVFIRDIGEGRRLRHRGQRAHPNPQGRRECHKPPRP
jgi:hypothetical protein